MIRVVRSIGVVVGAIIGGQVAELVRTYLVRFSFISDGGDMARLSAIGLGIVLGGAIGWAVARPFGVLFIGSMASVLHHLGSIPLRDILSGASGLILGLLIAALVSSTLRDVLHDVPIIGPVIIPLAALLVFGYLGLQLGIQRREDILTAFPRMAERLGRDRRRSRGGVPKILDTSVIIDGRIADICQAGFLEGPLLVPRPVLAELQRIADASDPLRRNRGRRGLDILNTMQKEFRGVHIYEEGEGHPGETVDAQLVRFARTLGASIVTNDYNLNKVAELQGVRVLNVNELANAIKPVMLPGEELSVHLIKDGKEAGQGVGYLDDGTMIVVEGGKKHIGETLDAVVTSVLQTVAGRMIFARPKVLEKDGAAR
jgi:uncharacterized protein YacL